MSNLRIAAAQAHPVWLDAAATTKKIVAILHDAAKQNVDLLAFPETFLPGYPFWVMLGGLDRFNTEQNRIAYAKYVEAAVELDGRDIKEIVEAVRDLRIFTFLGIAERSHASVYASMVAISPQQGIVGVHRKLMPTYGERTVWAAGDGHGLRVHRVGEMLVGGLNCWENWMPMARHALYSAGEEIHVAAWPGSAALTTDIARFIALEGRVWVVLASGLLNGEDVPADFPYHDLIANKPAGFYNGGSCIVTPDGKWAAGPVENEERLVVADVDRATVLSARQTFDPTGHYSRSDVFSLSVNRRRLEPAVFAD